jgi:hypothetical protein
MRLLNVLTAGFLMASLASASRLAAVQTATFKKAELGHRFLLQVSYEQKSGLRDFRTSRSRIVTFHRDGAVLHMLDVSDTRASASNHVFATIPIRDEDRDMLSLDLNEGFDTVHSEEDRTGKTLRTDQTGMMRRHSVFRAEADICPYHDAMLVFDQEARLTTVGASSFTTI